MKADGSRLNFWHDEGNGENYDPQALGYRLIGSVDAGVDEQDRNGRPPTAPYLFEVFLIRVLKEALDANPLIHFGLRGRSVSKTLPLITFNQQPKIV